MSRVLIGVAAAARATTCITLAATIRRPEGQPLPTGKTDWAALDAMTDEELEAAASADPDCPPLRDDQTLRHMARAKWTRFDLRLDRKAFAERYHIPLATLVAWERDGLEPDVAMAFFDAIAVDPEGVAMALSKSRAAREAAE